MAKTILSSKFTEWEGLDAIQSAVHSMRCIFREISKDDFGIDGEIEIVSPKLGQQGYQTTGGIIKVQAKSGKSYVRSDTDTTFITPVEKNDLETWHSSNVPVILVVFHPIDEVPYWKDIKSYIASNTTVFQRPYHIKFDKSTDVFDSTCYDRLRNLAGVSSLQITHQQNERLYSNILRVKRQPMIMTHAATDYTVYEDIRTQLIPGFVPPFCIHNGRLYTFSNLRDKKCNLRQFCDVSAISDMAPNEWRDDPQRERDYMFLLNQLLGIHMRRCGLKYNPRFKRNYFPRRNDESQEVKRKWFNIRTQRTVPARTVVKYYEYGFDKFWRHQAVQLRFKFVKKELYLEITPRYFFTEDGEYPWDKDKVGAYTTRIRSQERNVHFLNHVLFWSDVISNHQPIIKMKLDNRTIITMDKEPGFGIANFAIPGDPAIYQEDDPTGQHDFFDMLTSDDMGDEDEYYD